MFELRLYSAGLQGQQGVLGDKTVINITIKENDDAYGVFGFRTANIVKTIGIFLLFDWLSFTHIMIGSSWPESSIGGALHCYHIGQG